MRLVLLILLAASIATPTAAQEARRRWKMQRQIRLDKFDQVLPHVMRKYGIDMWIVAVKENHTDPLWEDLGRGYVSGIGITCSPIAAALGSSGRRLGRPAT